MACTEISKRHRSEQGCPVCDHKMWRETQYAQVRECDKCGAIYGTCYKGQSYEIVKPQMTAETVADENLRYYDLEVLGSQGHERRHGWFDATTGCIVQTGYPDPNSSPSAERGMIVDSDRLIVVQVQGGVCVGVYHNDPEGTADLTNVVIVDYDNIEQGDEPEVQTAEPLSAMDPETLGHVTLACVHAGLEV